MLQHGRSPSSSPIRKRQRLSSPTYDDQMPDLTQDCLDAFDEIQFTLSQAQKPLHDTLISNAQAQHPSADSDSPFLVGAAYTLLKGKGKAVNAKNNESSISSVPLNVLPLFQSAKMVDLSKITGPEAPLCASSNKENAGFLLPSEAALKAAQAKLKLWERDWDVDPLEEEEELGSETLSDLIADNRAAAAPPAFASPLKPLGEMLPPTSTPIPPLSRTSTGFTSSGSSSQSRAFRPLTIKTPAPAFAPSTFRTSTAFISSPRPPVSNSVPIPHTPKSTAFSTPVKTRLPLHLGGATPLKSLASTPRSIGISKKAQSSFVTPFRSQRSGMNPLLKTQLQNRIYPPAGRSTPAASTQNAGENTDFQKMQFMIPIKLHPPPSNRKPLQSSGLRPQQYDAEELEDMGLNVAELSQVQPATALHYCFYSFPSALPSSSQEPEARILLNSAAAYQELLKKGCHLATEEWVSNHWCLILWKLAGMAALDPSSEQDARKKRWCWAEVMRQLHYRYDVELDGGKRPILRRIAAQDSPANIPLVLCVSAIIQGNDGSTMLEVTDGWYRLRAEIDAPLSRAVKRGIIREGRKIVVSGARLHSEKKEPSEILEAYDSVTLRISANSSNLAPWYAKLGNQHERYIATLYSLMPDGGVVSCLDVEILRVHPIGYIEFFEKDGHTIHDGPRNEVDEARAADEWMKRRDKEVSKLRQEHEKRISRYMDYLSRLEGKASKCRPIGDEEECPDYIDNYYDDLEEHGSALQRLASIPPLDARWLAQFVRQNFETEQQRINEEIEKELTDLCPPRNVRNFRVLVVKDFRTERRPSNRVALITVWDASHFDTSTSDSFAVGQRYLVSNLVPTQHKAWMKEGEAGAEIFMQTRKETRWLKRKGLV